MSNASVGTGRDHTNEIRRLSTLLEVGQALSGVLNLKAALQSVLDLLERRHQVTGGTIFSALSNSPVARTVPMW